MTDFKPGQKVRCVDGTPHGGGLGFIEKDKIYTIKQQNPTTLGEYFLEEIASGSWMKSRFVAVDDAIQNNTVTNDYVCLLCKNDRLSRTERSCWKCGEPVKP